MSERGRGWRSRAVAVLIASVVATACGQGADSVSPTPPPEDPPPTVAPTSTASPAEASPGPVTTLPPSEATVDIVPSADLPPAPATPPSRLVVGAQDGELLLLDRETTDVLEALHEFDDPRDAGADGEPIAAGSFIDDVEVVGDQVLVAVCCEPAVGAIRWYPLGGSGGPVDRTVAYGDDPAAAYDGQLATAFATGDFIAVHDTAPLDLDRSGQLIDLTQLVGVEQAVFTTALDLAWAPDGRHLAMLVTLDERPEELWILDTMEPGRLVARLEAPDGRGWDSPVFLRDGALVLIERDASQEVGSTLVTLDLSTRQRRSELTLAVPTRKVRADVTHTFLLMTGEDGSLRWRAGAEGPETVITASGVLDADWA